MSFLLCELLDLFSFLPFKEYTEPLLIDRVLGAIGYALYRIMAPGMVAMLVAARSGSGGAGQLAGQLFVGDQHHSALYRLDLTGCDRLTNASLCDIAEHCGVLRELVQPLAVTVCHRVGDGAQQRWLVRARLLCPGSK